MSQKGGDGEASDESSIDDTQLDNDSGGVSQETADDQDQSTVLETLVYVTVEVVLIEFVPVVGIAMLIDRKTQFISNVIDTWWDTTTKQAEILTQPDGSR